MITDTTVRVVITPGARATRTARAAAILAILDQALDNLQATSTVERWND